MNETELFEDLAEDIRDAVEDDLKANDSIEPFAIVFRDQGDPSTLRPKWDIWENVEDGFTALALAARNVVADAGVVLSALISEMDAPPPHLAASRAVRVFIRIPPQPDIVSYFPFVVRTRWLLRGPQREVEFFAPVTIPARDERLN